MLKVKHGTPIRMNKIPTDNTKCCWGSGATGTLIHCYWECKTGPATLGESLTVSYIILPDHLAIMLLSTHPNEQKTYAHKITCIQMFIEVLFIIAKSWKQPRSPSIDNKLWYIQIIKYYLVIKRNELPSYEKIWRKFKCIK